MPPLIGERGAVTLLDVFEGRRMLIAYYFMGLTPLQSATLSDVALRLGATPRQVALAWLLQRSRNILVIPGTSSIEYLRDNLQASMLQIPSEVIAISNQSAEVPHSENRFRKGARSERLGSPHLLLNPHQVSKSDSLPSAALHRF